MDKKTSRHFAEIIELTQSVFENVTYEIDATPDRSILRIEAEYGKHEILVTELFSDGIRKYRYYVMRGDWVEAGVDNAPDPRAIRLKYGNIGEEHAGENIPHISGSLREISLWAIQVGRKFVINKEQVSSIHQPLQEMIYEAFTKALRNYHQRSHHGLSAYIALPGLRLL